MTPIIIPGLDVWERRQARAYQKFGYAPKEEHDEPQAVIAGLATKYYSPHIYQNRIEMFEPGVFAKSLASKKSINLQLDHNASTVAASTASGLELEETELGLLFRLPLNRVRNGSILARMVETGGRACASVGYRVVAEREETYGGHAVRVITGADLSEVSLCAQGAVGRAFAYLTDAVRTPTIKGMENTILFSLESATHRVKHALGGTTGTLDQLNARLRQEAGMPSYSSESSNEVQDINALVGRIVANLKTLKV